MSPKEYQYKVAYAPVSPDLANLNSNSWDGAEIKNITNFYFLADKKTRYLPETKFKIMYGEKGLYIIFLVHDKYVVSKHPMQGSVCRDSCVEFFFQIPGKGAYFTLEMAAGGNFLTFYITKRKKDFVILPEKDYSKIKIVSSMKNRIFDEIKKPQRWTLGAFIPYSLLSKYHGSKINKETVKGQIWRGNLYKCADLSNPHWASWAKMPICSFHMKNYFGYLNFQ